MPMAWPYQQAPYPGYSGMTPSGVGQAAPPTSGYAPFAPPMTPEQELDFLKSQAEAMKGQLEQIEARMRELETK